MTLTAQRTRSPRPVIDRWLAFVALFVTITMTMTIWAYWPGLTGPFLLDDSTNLASLGDNGGIHDWRSAYSFISENRSGPLHRPISMASFVANAQDWPADPYPFKATNLFIHLLNTLLVFLLARQLLGLAKCARPLIAAALCAALWALHPMQVSTVLYVIQRMTELAALFSLLGLICYIHGRQLVAQPMAARAWMATGIGFFGLLAVLSKESGVLLPLFALCLEVTLLTSITKPSGWKPLSFLLLGVPAIAFVAYFLVKFPDLLAGYQRRDFSMTQRLLTQGRVMSAYLHDIVIPNLSSASVFHDGFTVSTSLFTPISTLWSWLLVVGLIGTAAFTRRRHPVLAFGILWYFCGQLLESTIVPLELYFEHRNYLPSFGFALAASFYVLQLTVRNPKVGGLVVAAFLSLELWITHQQTQIWGNEPIAVALWPKEHPDSLRVQQFAARYWITQGDDAKAQAHIEAFATRHPESATAHLQAIELRCTLGDADEYALASIETLQRGEYDRAGPDTLAAIQRLLSTGNCASLRRETLMQAIDAYAENPTVRALGDQLGYVYFIKASLLASDGRFDEAVACAEKMKALRTDLFATYWQARWMLEAGEMQRTREYFAQALGQYHAAHGANAELDDEMKALESEIDEGQAHYTLGKDP